MINLYGYVIIFPVNMGCARYCNGFPKKRKSKRFRKSDPKYKPPKWCPRLTSPPVCRVYGFVDEKSEFLEWRLNRKDYKPGAHIPARPFSHSCTNSRSDS